MIPKGTALIIGGREERGEEENEMEQQNKKYEQFEILKELLPKNKKNQRIEIITTASDVPEEMQKMYVNAFKKIDFANVGFMDIRDKHAARDSKICKRVEKAHAVFFTGGDQFKLSAILGGTDTVSVIRDKYIHDKDFIVGGTSAGAMAMTNIMIYEGGVHEAILKCDLKMSSGMGIIDGLVIDTHFIKRGRFGRLAHAITMNPEPLGIGLGEDTALIIKNGCDAECRGSGMVIIIDGMHIEHTNITETADGDPIFVENLKIHILAKGCKFSITDRRMPAQSLTLKPKRTKTLS
jgi:cyanophycinase